MMIFKIVYFEYQVIHDGHRKMFAPKVKYT